MSAVKLLKYLIVINHINVIINLRLIAINHTFLSILNLMLLSKWKSGSACFVQMFFY